MTDAPALERLAVHTITLRGLSLPECIDAIAGIGAGGISIWREAIAELPTEDIARRVRDAGLRVPSLVRAGFFVDPEPASRARAVDDARRAIDEAAALDAPTVVVVCGSHPAVPLGDGRAMTADALGQLVEDAAARGVRLALEPLHPMYAADRSCITTLGQARAMCEAIDHDALAVAVDVYHVWWDDALASHVEALGAAGRIAGFHVCDWKVDTAHLLTDRGLMGEGCIPIRSIRSMVENAGFDGMIEVEIFSERWWGEDPRRFLDAIRSAYLAHA